MSMHFAADRAFDVIAVGRATIDLYANEIGPMEDAVTFSKFVGGSPANTSVALSNMGMKVGYIGKVSDDQFGRYITDYLATRGIDISHIAKAAPGIRSGVTIGETKSPTECSFFMYRTNAADLYINCAEIDENYIKSAKCLLISGTSLSHSPAREAIFLIMEFARRNAVRVIFDPDYREYTWNSLDEAAVYYRLAMEKADMVVGTREELAIAERLLMPGNVDDAKTAAALHACGVSLVCIKHGKNGSTVFSTSEGTHEGKSYPAKVCNTFGAGDAYAGAFLAALVRGHPVPTALCYGAAAASITISGLSCAASTPTLADVEAFLRQHETNWGKHSV